MIRLHPLRKYGLGSATLMVLIAPLRQVTSMRSLFVREPAANTRIGSSAGKVTTTAISPVTGPEPRRQKPNLPTDA